MAATLVGASMTGCARSQVPSASNRGVAAVAATAPSSNPAPGPSVVKETIVRYRAVPVPVQVGEAELKLAAFDLQRSMAFVDTAFRQPRPEGWNATLDIMIDEPRLNEGRCAKIVVTRILGDDGREVKFREDKSVTLVSAMSPNQIDGWFAVGMAMRHESRREDRTHRVGLNMDSLPRRFARVEGVATIEAVTAKREVRVSPTTPSTGIEIVPGAFADVVVTLTPSEIPAFGNRPARKSTLVRGHLTIRYQFPSDVRARVLTPMPLVNAIRLDGEGEGRGRALRPADPGNVALPENQRRWNFEYSMSEDQVAPQLVLTVVTATESVDIPFALTDIPGAE
jgi:hypothetical protein